MGWMTQEEQQIVGAQAKTVGFAYNSVGFRTGLTYPSSKVITFVPDELNRNAQIQDSQSNNIAEYGYVGPWRVNQRDYLNGTRLSVDYDASRRVTSYSSENTISSTLVAGFEYAYNNEDFKLYEKRTYENKGDAYLNDSIYRLVGVKYGVTNLAPAISYTSYTSYDNEETFALDGVGNRTQVVSGSQTTNYTVNALNQYTQISGTSLTYDYNGNLTGDGTYTYAYDYANRLMEVKSGGTTIASYKYDALGRRIEKVTTNGTIRFVLDKDRVIGEYDESDVLLAEYTFGNGIDEVLQMSVPITSAQHPITGTYYYHENTLGSIYAVTDNSGNVVERYTYGSYGLPSFFDGLGTPISNSLISNNYLFTGRELDTETGLYYYRARYFSPELGRFLSRDPIGYAGGVNLYSYCGNNPVDYTDPMGLEEKSWLDKQIQKIKDAAAAIEKAIKDALDAIEKELEKASKALEDLKKKIEKRPSDPLKTDQSSKIQILKEPNPIEDKKLKDIKNAGELLKKAIENSPTQPVQPLQPPPEGISGEEQGKIDNNRRVIDGYKPNSKVVYPDGSVGYTDETGTVTRRDDPGHPSHKPDSVGSEPHTHDMNKSEK
jgi:RHS repeat-associated protein